MLSLISKEIVERLRLQVYEPHSMLAHWVQCFWGMPGGTGSLVAGAKVYPDGGASLTVTFTSPRPQIEIFLNRGTFAKEIAISESVISVRFKPAGIYSLLGPDMSLFADQPLRLGLDITPSWYFSLLRLVECLPVNNLDQCVLELQAWLLSQQTLRQSADKGIPKLITAVQQSTAPLKSLEKTLGLSQRTLERHLRRTTGFSPQELVDFGRMQRARKLLCSPEISLADVAIRCGYFDQAHFSHRFKRYALETPAAYRKRKLS